MKNYDQSIEINHNLNWSYIPDHQEKPLDQEKPTVIELNKVSMTRY